MQLIIPWIVNVFGTLSSVCTTSDLATPKELGVVIVYGRVHDLVLQSAGSIIDVQRGWILTTYHSLQRSQDWAIVCPQDLVKPTNPTAADYQTHYRAKKARTCQLLWANPRLDIALLQCDKPLPKVQPIVFTTTMTKGVKVIGHPLMQDLVWDTVAGTIESIEKRIWQWDTQQHVQAKMLTLQMQKPLSSGFSGAPVLCGQGKALGMILASPKLDQGTAYAVHAQEIQQWLKEITWLHTHWLQIQRWISPQVRQHSPLPSK